MWYFGGRTASEEPEESVRITKIRTPVRAFRNEYSEGGVQAFRKIPYWRCLARNKGGAMTAKEAALTAGYHRSTFYAYFDSAADLADAAEEDLLDEALSTLFSRCGTALRARFLRQDAADFAAKLRAILLPLARMAGPKDADGMGGGRSLQ